MLLSAHILAVVLFAASPPSPIKHFRPIEKSDLPKTFLQYLCGNVQQTTEKTDCIDSFEKNGAVWAGDVNDDNADEYIVDSGRVPGTLGPALSLLQLRGSDWVELICRDKEEDFCDSSWNTLRARFDILPTVRNGYHDLRVEVSHCLKWDGKRYVDYDEADYTHLRSEWFDTSDSHEAELFWVMRYQERKTIWFEPQWFTVSIKEFNRRPQAYMSFPVRVLEFPRLPYATRRDPELGLTWLSFFKGGVWGLQGNRAFLLVPQPSYLGAQRLELRGEWLLIYGELEEPDDKPDISYNRYTHELRYAEN
jgi:hypothetical protein